MADQLKYRYAIITNSLNGKIYYIFSFQEMRSLPIRIQILNVIIIINKETKMITIMIERRISKGDTTKEEIKEEVIVEIDRINQGIQLVISQIIKDTLTRENLTNSIDKRTLRKIFNKSKIQF